MRAHWLIMATGALGLAAGSASGQHTVDELIVAVNSAGTLHLEPESLPVFLLEHSEVPAFPGFILTTLGFESLELPDPMHGIFPPAPAADVRVVLLAIDPGIKVYADLVNIPVGGEIALGHPFFHYHPLWHVEHGHPGEQFSMTMRLRDAAGVHAPSEPFMLVFSPECCVDFNADMEVDFSDIEGFLAAYGAGTLGHCAPGADFNDDGELDFSDIETFLSEFVAGC